MLEITQRYLTNTYFCEHVFNKLESSTHKQTHLIHDYSQNNVVKLSKKEGYKRVGLKGWY